MARDTMPHNSNIELGELNELIDMLGMNNDDVKDILVNRSVIKEQTYLSIGPKPYWADYYGSISIKDF